MREYSPAYLPNTVNNLNEIKKKQIAIWIDPDLRSTILNATLYPRTTHSYRPVLISMRLNQHSAGVFVILILNLIALRFNQHSAGVW